jgi:hypothetical protein
MRGRVVTAQHPAWLKELCLEIIFAASKDEAWRIIRRAAGSVCALPRRKQNIVAAALHDALMQRDETFADGTQASFADPTHGPATSTGDETMPTIRDIYQSKYLKAADLRGGTIIVTISRVDVETFENDGKQTIRPVIHFRENNVKPLVCNKTNGELIDKLYPGDFANWSGKKITLAFGLVNVKGQQTETIRVLPPPAESPAAQKAAVAADLNDEIPFG